MSDNSRRAICRFLFLALCAIPTSGVVYFLLHQPTAADWSEMIQAKLGIDVQIDSVETPHPGRTVLRGLTIDDANGAPPIKVTAVDIQNGRLNEIFVYELLTIAPDRLVNMIREASNSVLRPNKVSGDWRIHLAKLTVKPLIESGELDLVLKDVQIDLRMNEQGIQMGASMRKAFDDPNNQIVCGTSTTLDAKNSGRRIWLNTGSASVPCWLASQLAPNLQSFGPECRFRGIADFHVDEHSQIGGRLRGDFLEIQLEELAKPFGQRIWGSANSYDTQCILSDSRVEMLKGRLKSINGGAGADVLYSAEQLLNVVSQKQIAQRFVPFKLDVEFDVSGDSLHIYPGFEDKIAFDMNDYALMKIQLDDNGQPKNKIDLADFARFWTKSTGSFGQAEFLSLFRLPNSSQPAARTADGLEQRNNY